ncbi:MAG: type II secretion system F family protein [bacterium]|nr:type II secretion system F family protein [bacterium]
MAKFFYQARNLNGDQKAGEFEAKDEKELAMILREEGYFIVKAETEKKKRKQFAIPAVFNGVSLVSKLMFTRNLRVMVSAGVSLPRVIGILAEQAKSRKFKKVLQETKECVLKGDPLSNSLEKYPSIFSDLFVSMIRVGEETGTLEDVLRVLSEQLEKEHQLKSRVRNAMVYPAVILAAMILIATAMLIFVIPKLASTFEEMNVKLPFTTRVIISTGEFLSVFWYLVPIIFVLVVLGTKFALRSKTGKVVLDALTLKIPLVGGILKKTNSAYTVRTLSSLISAGVPIVRSLEIVSSSLTNIYYRKAIAEAAEKVKKGAKLSEALAEHGNIYPSLVIQMIEVGGETGETAEILKKLAIFYEEEVDNATKNLSTIVEPLLMIVIGAAVAFFAVSMLQPIYGLMETL